MRIIAFLGKKGSGKDTAVEILDQLAKTQGNVTLNIITLADPLKEEMYERLFKLEGFEPRCLYDRKIKETFRDFIIAYSNKFKKIIKTKYVWMLKAKKKLIDDPNVINVITDIRIKDEIKFFNQYKGYDFTTVKIIRSKSRAEYYLQCIWDRIKRKDATETELDFYPADYEIFNSSSLEDYQDKVTAFFHSTLPKL